MTKLPSPDDWSASGCLIGYAVFVAIVIVLTLFILYIFGFSTLT